MNFNPWEFMNVWFLAYSLTGKLLFVDHWTSEDWMKLMGSKEFMEAIRALFQAEVERAAAEIN